MTRYTRWTMPLLLCLLTLSAPTSYAHGQETMCVSKHDFREAVRAECRDYQAKAGQYDVCRAHLAKQVSAFDQCRGQLAVLVDIDRRRIEAEIKAAEGYSVWSVLTGVVVGVVAGIIGALVVTAE
jgi:hypothetical protein